MRQETLDTICKVLGEFVGTGLLLLFACMGLIQWTDVEQPNFAGGLVFGLTIMFVIQVVGAVSGTITSTYKLKQFFNHFLFRLPYKSGCNISCSHLQTNNLSRMKSCVLIFQNIILLYFSWLACMLSLSFSVPSLDLAY